MSQLYYCRQKDICDSHIRKSVFSAESVQILVAVFIHLCHKQFVTSMKDSGHIGCHLCPVSLDCQWKVGHYHNLRVLQSWLYFISASCGISVMSHYKIFFTKPTFTNRIVFDRTPFQELVPIPLSSLFLKLSTLTVEAVVFSWE
jgi:hypothetical protein